ncbi:MAG: DNA-binding protein WhiA [Clostridia bacterium]|nr:DNA-binding protein WhiA [Clostridia bacterium]
MSFSSDIKDYLSVIKEKKDCCTEAFVRGFEHKACQPKCDKDLKVMLRGLFVSSGNIIDPNKGYYLTLSFTNEYIDYIYSLLCSMDLEPKALKRHDEYILYYKESERIEDFLTVIGAGKFALELMEAKVLKETRNNLNRLNNAEIANMTRTAEASAEACDAIHKLEKHGMLSHMSDAVQETARLRLEYPEYNLEQLRELHSRPISKSGLYHRLNKLINEARNIQD